MHLLLALLVVLLLGFCGPAQAHTTGPEFVTFFDSISPHVAGIRVFISPTGTAPRVTIEGHRSHTFEVSGLEGEPFALINEDGAFVNDLSGSAYLTQEPGTEPRPPKPSTEPGPRWRSVSEEPRFSYYEPRAEWPHIGPPPDVERIGRRATILRWQIPATYDGSPVSIRGRVDWVPPGLNFEVFMLGAAVLLLAFWWLEPKVRGVVRPMARGLAVTLSAVIALEAGRVIWGTVSDESESAAPLALLPALALVALSSPLIWRANRRGFAVALVFGIYVALLGLSNISGGSLNAPAGARWIQAAFGLVLVVGGGLLLFVTRAAAERVSSTSLKTGA